GGAGRLGGAGPSRPRTADLARDAAGRGDRRAARGADRGQRGTGAARGRDVRLRGGVAEVSDLYPVGLMLAGRRVLVVGGGAGASRRVPALLSAGADVLLVSPEVTPALRALIDAGRITWVPRRFEPSDVDGSWLVQAAVDDPAAGAEVSEAAESRRV